VTPNGLPMPG